MAKAPKTITILCEDSIAALPELVALAEKGHMVHSFTEFREESMDLEDYDLILGKQCCMYQEKMEKYLPDMIRGARQRKYGSKGLTEELDV